MSAVIHPSSELAPRPSLGPLLEQWRQRQFVVLKINADLEYQITDEGSFQKLLDLLERLDNIAAIQKGLDDVAAGRTMSMDQFKQQVHGKHGISG